MKTFKEYLDEVYSQGRSNAPIKPQPSVRPTRAGQDADEKEIEQTDGGPPGEINISAKDAETGDELYNQNVTRSGGKRAVSQLPKSAKGPASNRIMNIG